MPKSPGCATLTIAGCLAVGTLILAAMPSATSAIDTQRQAAMQRAATDPNAADRRGGAVWIHSINHTFTEKHLQQKSKSRSRPQPHVKSFGSRSWSWSRDRKADAILAPGTDFQLHLINGYLSGWIPFPAGDLWVPFITVARHLTYREDPDEFGGYRDIWQTSREAFLHTRGDCEDHALILADWLIEMGHDARVVLGNADGNGHAWVVLFIDNQTFLLEATEKGRSGIGVGSRRRHYPLAALHPEYEPKHMFNRHTFWTNVGAHKTVSYSGPMWQERSTYLKP